MRRFEVGDVVCLRSSTGIWMTVERVRFSLAAAEAEVDDVEVVWFSGHIADQHVYRGAFPAAALKLVETVDGLAGQPVPLVTDGDSTEGHPV